MIHKCISWWLIHCTVASDIAAVVVILDPAAEILIGDACDVIILGVLATFLGNMVEGHILSNTPSANIDICLWQIAAVLWMQR